jgi:hypothetical protein
VPLTKLWDELPLHSRQQALRTLTRVIAQQILAPPTDEEVAHDDP